MRLYEVVTPLRALVTELQVKKNNLTDDLDSHRKQIKSLMEVRKTLLFLFHVRPQRVFIKSVLTMHSDDPK